MKRADILKLSAMPAASPSYPLPPFRFVDREYMTIIYESDPDAIRAALPEPLAPDSSNQVFYEWIRMPDSSGFGDYTETGVVIPCSFEGKPASFVSQMYLDDEAPIAAGREIWGFPKKFANPKLEVISDTLTGTLDYAGQRVAMGSMVYKHENQSRHPAKTAAAIRKLQVLLKLIPDVDGKPKIAQLVGLHITEVTVKGSWSGPARLHLVPHVNAPVADLPVRKVLGGRHFVADLTLPGGHVLVDYMKS
jgi:acetoacetate decarboxylase